MTEEHLPRTVYLSGPITDGGSADPETVGARLQAFREARYLLEAQGLRVLDPTRHEGGPASTWLDYMRLALLDLAQADEVVALPGWEYSRGARIEVKLANDLGIPVRDLEEPDSDLVLQTSDGRVWVSEGPGRWACGTSPHVAARYLREDLGGFKVLGRLVPAELHSDQ